MKIKVFKPNPYGKVEFTYSELENLLNEIYADGVKDGIAQEQSKHSLDFTWTSPYIYNNNGIMPCSILSDKTSTSDTVSTTATIQAEGNDTSKTNVNNGKDVITINFSTDENIQEHLDNFLNSIKPIPKINDSFAKLAKELNF